VKAPDLRRFQVADKAPSAALLLKALASVRPKVRVAARFSSAPCICGFLGNLILSTMIKAPDHPALFIPTAASAH
jgi:hypothetical protein